MVSFYFLSGFLISTILLSWIITLAFRKYKSEAYVCTFGFMWASLYGMISSLFSYFNVFNLLLGAFLFYFGYFITYKLNNLFSNF